MSVSEVGYVRVACANRMRVFSQPTGFLVRCGVCGREPAGSTEVHVLLLSYASRTPWLLIRGPRNIQGLSGWELQLVNSIKFFAPDVFSTNHIQQCHHQSTSTKRTFRSGTVLVTHGTSLHASSRCFLQQFIVMQMILIQYGNTSKAMHQVVMSLVPQPCPWVGRPNQHCRLHGPDLRSWARQELRIAFKDGHS